MFLDQLIEEFDHSLRVVTGVMQSHRPTPQPPQGVTEMPLSDAEKVHAAGLMRINHVGEICAQALYQSQKLTTSSSSLKQAFAHAAQEEIDHLSWTAERLS